MENVAAVFEYIILNHVSVKFSSQHLTDDKSTLVQENGLMLSGCEQLPEPMIPRDHWVNTLRPRQNVRHFPDDIFKRIFLNQNVRIPINISLEFVPKGPINKIPTLVQIMAWRRSGAKPLSETMLVS